MNREELIAFIADLKKVRGAASDELAIDVSHIYPQWSGEGVVYQIGDRVLYNEVLYKVLIAHKSQNDWHPDIASSLFAKVLVSDDGDILPWEQPDSTNPYMQNDRVKHDGEVWISLINYNVWEPGVYGWEKV